MSQDVQLEKRFRALPSEAQRQVLDFLALVERRYRTASPDGQSQKPLRSYAFVGLWQERDEMQDSRTWVRRLREQEWRD